MVTNISTDENLRETLAVLQEAVEYMRRLPPVPVTLEMCRKLQRHLDELQSLSRSRKTFGRGARSRPSARCTSPHAWRATT